MSSRATLLVALLGLAACARPEPVVTRPVVHPELAAQGAAAPTPPSGGAVRRFGEPLTGDATTARLSEIVQTPDRFRDRPLRIEGRVAAVCQNMGCWMEIRDANLQAHIRMHGHSFFVPRDLNGHNARIQGTLVAAHSPTECDQEAQQATGRRAEVEFDARGVEVLD